jgi:nicotinic acetylcholine receptor
MGRPGEKITRKTIMMQNKMKELDLKERSSKSLLANVLDMDDDFRPSSTLPHSSHIHPHHPSHTHPPGMTGGVIGPLHNNASGNNSNAFARVSGLGGLPSLPGLNSSVSGQEDSSFPPGAFRELSLILKELRVITDKIRDDEDTAAIENDWKFAAMVLDRLCLLTFTAFTIVATIAVLVSAPHIIVT